MSSSVSKRRKVTVDIKQTRLERGSVFARLGNKDKLKKKVKAEAESSSKTKRESFKLETDAADDRKKTKQSSRLEDSAPVRKSLKDHSSSGKSKSNDYDSKQYKKSHRYSEERERTGSAETSRSHSKHKFDREEKMENLIIEKRVSLSPSPRYRSRSASPSSLSPKKKLKKHSAKRSSREKSQDRQRHHQSLSPEHLAAESHKHKERGRSREKKKLAKDGSKKTKEVFVEEQDLASKSETSKHLLAKGKKSSKHEKDHSNDAETEKKRSKSKHAKEPSQEREKSRHKISPVIYDHSSDDHVGKKREKLKDRGKVKRKKYESPSPTSSPVRRKKVKRDHSIEDNDCGTSKASSPAKAHTSKKRSYKDVEVTSKKKAQKDDSLPGTFSDYSVGSKHSQPEYSEISQESCGNDKHYSSDSFTEKETKKKSKTKKKARKDTESFSSKAHYEVIDDDFSDDAKKVKKRKRKRSDSHSPYLKSPVKQEEKHQKKERGRDEPSKKKIESYPNSPREKARRPDKYARDGHDSYERRNSPHDRFESSRRQKFPSEIKSELRSPDDLYYDSRKERDRDNYSRGKDVYTEPKRSREQRFSPERRDSGYTKSKPPPRHLASEKSTDSKVLDWQRKGSKHIVSERKESLPRLMSTQYVPDRRSEVLRQPASKYTLQRKLLEPEYLYTHEPLMGDADRSMQGSLDRVKRNAERRPPPLLPPNFSRNRSPPRTSSRNRGYMEQDRFAETSRKPHYRDSLPRNDNRDQKYSAVHDDVSERRVRSSSHDSRSSLRHSSLDTKGRHLVDITGGRGLQSPHSDRNSSLERRDHKKPITERRKYDKNEEVYERRTHHSIERVRNKTSEERLERGRPGERSRPLKRHLLESSASHRSSSLQSRTKEKRQSPRHASPSKRRTKEVSRSSSKRVSEGEISKTRTSRKDGATKRSEDLSDEDIDNLIKEEVDELSQEAEVNWNELPTTAVNKENKAAKQTSSVLSKFSPGNILRQTGIIMDMLPSHLIEKIKKLEMESAEEGAAGGSKSYVTGMVRNGLNAYSDEKLRKRLLGYNISNRHSFWPPVVINAKTYSASMKEYMRKMRMVEPV